MAYALMGFALLLALAGMVTVGQDFSIGGALCGVGLIVLVIGAIVANRGRRSPAR